MKPGPLSTPRHMSIRKRKRNQGDYTKINKSDINYNMQEGMENVIDEEVRKMNEERNTEGMHEMEYKDVMRKEMELEEDDLMGEEDEKKGKARVTGTKGKAKVGESTAEGTNEGSLGKRKNGSNG